MPNYSYRMFLCVLAAVALASPPAPARAAESATSVYLLGSKGTLAGMTPPPGLYIADANYYYAGEASGSAARSVTIRQTGISVPVGDCRARPG